MKLSDKDAAMLAKRLIDAVEREGIGMSLNLLKTELIAGFALVEKPQTIKPLPEGARERQRRWPEPSPNCGLVEINGRYFEAAYSEYPSRMSAELAVERAILGVRVGYEKLPPGVRELKPIP